MDKNSIFSDYKTKTFLFLFFLICTYPFLFIAQYNIPLSDEFVCMYYRSFNSFIDYQKILYNTWSGRYIANTLEIIYPLNVYYPFYQLIPVFIIAIFFLIFTLISKKITSNNYLNFSILIFLTLINYSPSIADLFYYVPAIINYTISFFSILLFIAIWLSEINIKYKTAALTINNIILLGTSELYIPLVISFSFFLLLKSIKEKKIISLSVINVIITFAIVIFLLTGNGNLNRYEIQKSELNIFSCTYNYVYSIFYWTKKFLLSVPFVLFAAYTVKNEARVIALSNKIKFVTLFYFAIGYFILFVPLFFINLTYYIRTANIFFMYFLAFSLTISIKIVTNSTFNIKISRWIIFTIAILFFSLTGNIKYAYSDLYHGYTRNMSKALRMRYNYLENNRNSKQLILDKIPKTEYLLMIQDVNDKNESSLVIDMYKRYYRIDSLIIR